MPGPSTLSVRIDVSLSSRPGALTAASDPSGPAPAAISHGRSPADVENAKPKPLSPLKFSANPCDDAPKSSVCCTW